MQNNNNNKKMSTIQIDEYSLELLRMKHKRDREKQQAQWIHRCI